MTKIKDNLTSKDKSIYYILKEFYDINSEELYNDQDFEKAGKVEFNCVTNKTDRLKEYEKNRLAHGLIKIMLNEELNKETVIKISNYITLNPIVTYYNELVKEFKYSLELSENKNKISCLLEKFIIESSSSEEIKLGLLLGPICKIKSIDEFLKIFSIHNEYIFYVVKAYEYTGNRNENIFELAKKSEGYGKVFCVMSLIPTNDEIKKWMIEEGPINQVGIPELLSSCMLSIDILEYLESKEFNSEEIEVFSKTFSMLLSDYGIYEIKDAIKVCKKLINIIDKVDGKIYSLYSVISIIYSIEAVLIDDYKTKRNHSFFKYSNDVKDIVESCKRICKKEIWHKVIGDNVLIDDIDSSVIISCSEKTSYHLKKKEFEILLKRDSTNALLYKYAFAIGNKALKKCAFELGLRKLPMNKILSGQDEIRIDNLSYEDIGQICFFIVIKYAQYEDFSDKYKDINLQALRAALIETRIQAATNLQRFIGEFDSYEEELISNAISCEMVDVVRRTLNSLLIKTNNKEKKYIKIKESMIIEEHTKDIYLNSIYVAGTNYLDISEAYNKLTEGSILCLIREPNNPYDSNAILISTVDGHVIGYVPKESNLILKNLIDNGKYLYGKIKEVSDEFDHINVDIYLSYKDIIEEITGTLSLLSGERKSYLQ
ncbi:HIRAN domain-containing protein [Clostridium sp. C2-6-12]|uniref:HIRAN domain-containing protein n=1 Tax=Clostridium sp. C2-6-12 TaxID=2698832 RepID=UPI00136FADA9|nr:HIRAN domain-containing protein [Clostridium sp. C2-6-12]